MTSSTVIAFALGAVFGEFWGAPAYKEYLVCPDCRSDEIEEYHESEETDDE